jgi:hypothetical protein
VKSFGSKRGFPVFLSLCITLFPALAGAQQISLTPSTLSFGDVSVGSSKTQTVVVKNITKRRIGMFQASVSGKGYTISGISCPVDLRAGQSMSFSVTFTPPSAETDSGLVSLVTDNWWKRLRSEPSTSGLTLSGSGVASGEISASPASVAFGNVMIGNSQTVPVTVTNTGGVTVTISAAAATGAGFSFSGPILPATLAAGQSTTFNAIFSPTSSGSKTGNLAITSDANNPTLNVPLSGVGVTQGQIAPNPASLSFGNVVVGSSKTLTETLTNSGGSSLTISAASASGTGFTLSGLALPLTLTAGQSTTFSVQFAPTAAGAVSGNVTITSNGANPTLNIPVSGTGVTPGTLSANPTSLSFGSVQVGNTASLSETLTNTGGTAVTISQANVTGAGFSITGLTLPTTLNAAQSVTFTVKFAPTSAGAVSGNLAIVSDASNSTLNIGLSGTGTAQGQLSVSPGTLNFGNVVVNASASLNGSLTASGASVTVTSGSSDSSEFVLSGITLPKTIAAGQSASFTVTFTPNASGAASASLTFLSNASNSPTVETLTGTGQAPQPHSVDLSWTASQSPGVVGYNIYRGSVAGGPYSKVNSTLNADTTYTDSTVTAGQTYFYVAKGVDGNDMESGPSNEVQATIPNP